MTPCLDCGVSCSGPRCRACARAKRRQLYGPDHDAERKAWAPSVALGLVECWRCDEPIPPGSAWDLGHTPTGRRPEHPRCNRAAH